MTLLLTSPALGQLKLEVGQRAANCRRGSRMALLPPLSNAPWTRRLGRGAHPPPHFQILRLPSTAWPSKHHLTESDHKPWARFPFAP
jgi:hypothetical protein